MNFTPAHFTFLFPISSLVAHSRCSWPRKLSFRTQISEMHLQQARTRLAVRLNMFILTGLKSGSYL